MDKYVPRRDVLKVLKIHYQTLYGMRDRKEIDSLLVGKKYLYNLDKYLKDRGKQKAVTKINICYCRVSSRKQSEDLKRQISYMIEKYPEHIIIKDIGSGLNFKRKGLKKILELGINGEINELVISYKDRLARFGYEMIEWILKKYSDSDIIIINKDEEDTTKDEITKDLVAIMNVYVAKINGLRKYKKKIEKTIKKA